MRVPTFGVKGLLGYLGKILSGPGEGRRGVVRAVAARCGLSPWLGRARIGLSPWNGRCMGWPGQSLGAGRARLVAADWEDMKGRGAAWRVAWVRHGAVWPVA